MTTYRWHTGKEGKDSQTLRHLRKNIVCKICNKKRPIFQIWHTYCSTKCTNEGHRLAKAKKKEKDLLGVLK